MPTEDRNPLAQSMGAYAALKPGHTLFSNETRAVVYGMHPVAVQSMLDFDHLCGRKQPSVSAIVYPFAGAHYRKFFWGSQEIMISVMPSLAEIFAKNPSTKVHTIRLMTSIHANTHFFR